METEPPPVSVSPLASIACEAAYQSWVVCAATSRPAQPEREPEGQGDGREMTQPDRTGAALA